MADYSPRAKYYEIAEAFNISGEKMLASDLVLAHIQAQVQEMKQICNRLLVDLAGAHASLARVKDHEAQAAYKNAVANQESELRQYSTKLDVLLKLKEELEAEG